MIAVPPACISEASSTYHIQVAAIKAVIEHGLPAGTLKEGRVGPMAIPVQWLPVFGLMGIDQRAVVLDACQNVYAGTWIMAYMAMVRDVENIEIGKGRSFKLSASLKERRKQWAPVVRKAALATGVPAELIDAVITVESGYQPRAVSGKKAIGLMQLIQSTADMLGGDPWDAQQNVMMGSRYLAQLLRQFHGNLVLALAAYNAGPAAVTRAGYRIPDFTETQAYVPMVISLYKSYQKGS